MGCHSSQWQHWLGGSVTQGLRPSTRSCYPPDGSGTFAHRHVAALLGVLVAVDLGSPRTLRTARHYQGRPGASGAGPFT